MTTNNLFTHIEEKGKKDKLFFHFYIVLLVFSSIFLFFSIGLLIYKPTSIFSIIFLVIFALFFILSLRSLIAYLIIPNRQIEFNYENNSLTVNKNKRHRVVINGSDVYAIESPKGKHVSLITNYTGITIYLVNGNKIKIKYLTDPKHLLEMLRIYLNVKPSGFVKLNFFKLIYHRFINFMTKIALYFYIPKYPTLYNCPPNFLDTIKPTSYLLVVGRHLSKTAYFENIKKLLSEKKATFAEFSEVSPNPTVENVEKGKDVFIKNNCKEIIAIGGGSVLDCAKGIAAVAYSKKPISKYKGYFKVLHKVPKITAIPTTCGTGSETTFASVIRDEKKDEKYAIVSGKIFPSKALLDPNLLLDLPNKILASTSMDALTHAIESYLNMTASRASKKESVEAIQLIFDNLEKAYDDPTNIEYKVKLLYASFLAGKAFNRGLVGSVHALSHALGGKYNIGHGETNARLLPVFLKYYIFKSYKKMGKLYNKVTDEKTSDLHESAYNLILRIDSLNKKFGFTPKIKELKKEDIDEIALHAYKESIKIYPCPILFSLEQYKIILRTLIVEEKDNEIIK